MYKENIVQEAFDFIMYCAECNCALKHQNAFIFMDAVSEKVSSHLDFLTSIVSITAVER
jgi:hypothetical protein